MQEVRVLEDLFRVSAGRPVVFGGEEIRLVSEVPVRWPTSSAVLSVLSYKESPQQGLCLELVDGQLEVNGLQSPAVCLWLEDAPAKIPIGLRANPLDQPRLRIWNCWRQDDEERQEWTGNAAMIQQHVGAGTFEFACSDGVGVPEFTSIEIRLAFGAT
ncbi:hypothetical protein [Streptomyces griseorubiginosus]|uniref:hypothetical protein n=1 Tax=Streptomyces griseorubiginosus TaxID=67304 RepID=UPI0033F54CFA